MRDRTVRKYSACFKQPQRAGVADLENGRFESIQAARIHYGVGGCGTIQRWLKQYGKNHLLGKVIRVEKPNEADRIGELKRQVAALQPRRAGARPNAGGERAQRGISQDCVRTTRPGCFDV